MVDPRNSTLFDLLAGAQRLLGVNQWAAWYQEQYRQPFPNESEYTREVLRDVIVSKATSDPLMNAMVYDATGQSVSAREIVLGQYAPPLRRQTWEEVEREINDPLRAEIARRQAESADLRERIGVLTETRDVIADVAQQIRDAATTEAGGINLIAFGAAGLTGLALTFARAPWWIVVPGAIAGGVAGSRVQLPGWLEWAA